MRRGRERSARRAYQGRPSRASGLRVARRERDLRDVGEPCGGEMASQTPRRRATIRPSPRSGLGLRLGVGDAQAVEQPTGRKGEVMGKQSHGTIHHADTTVVCPGCGQKFTHPHHAAVAEDWGEFIGVQFKSKQSGRWGVLRVPIELVFWGDTRREAWDAEIAQRPRKHGEAMAQMAARIAARRREGDT